MAVGTREKSSIKGGVIHQALKGVTVRGVTVEFSV